MFPSLNYIHPYILFDDNGDYIKDKTNIEKDSIKRFKFSFIYFEIKIYNFFCKKSKKKLTKPNHRMCVWVCFQRCKLVFDEYNLNLNMEDVNNYLDEYLTENELNLKRKKI